MSKPTSSLDDLIWWAPEPVSYLVRSSNVVEAVKASPALEYQASGILAHPMLISQLEGVDKGVAHRLAKAALFAEVARSMHREATKEAMAALSAGASPEVVERSTGIVNPEPVTVEPLVPGTTPSRIPISKKSA